MSSIKDLIAKQRAELEVVRTQDIDVVLGGEKVTLTFEKAQPDEWGSLVGANPPRPGMESDALVGYNPRAVSEHYPRVQVDGEALDTETWAEVFSVLDAVWRNSVEVTIWGINISESLTALRELGKVPAGRKSPSPAN